MSRGKFQFFQRLATFYESGKKGIQGIKKIREGFKFQGTLDLLGSAGLALMLIPEAVIAGALLSVGASLVQEAQKQKDLAPLSKDKINFALNTGLSLSAFLFFIPGGFLPGTLAVGGISAIRAFLKRSNQEKQMLSNVSLKRGAL